MAGIAKTACAKINLSLDILGKRDDGYHDLRMIMQTIELHDTVCLESIPEGILLECNSKWVPQNGTNTAWKAAALLMERYDIKSGIKIRIHKRIPVAAGLAGGSTDAAAVLKGMNEMFSLKLDLEELRMLGRQIGADVPYCIDGGTRLAEGIGERLTPLPDFSGVDIVLVKPHIGVSTAWVYGVYDTLTAEDGDRPDNDLLIGALQQRDKKMVAENMKNVLEKVTIPQHGIVREVKNKLLEMGALGSMMSGSGPSVFGIFPDIRSAIYAYGKLATDRRWQVFLTKTSMGAEVHEEQEPSASLNRKQ